MTQWTCARARDLYHIPQWSEGYFDVSDQGHLLVHPYRDPARGRIDLHELAGRAQAAGLTLPVLLRFNDILQDRVRTLIRAFATATDKYDYPAQYLAVYPIKVNQQRSVVEEILRAGGTGVGLEAGSKPELMAVLGLSPPGGTIVCNGYKDREYIRRALIATRLGHRTFIVVEKPAELDLIIQESQALAVAPLLGIRVRLASIGSGNWQNTGGEKSKFGLSAAQVLAAVEQLRQADMLDNLQLLHFHMGSQIANLRDIQHGLQEAGRYFTELHALGVPIRYLDVGGGLGVDYEGTGSRSYCSMNYTVTEYAQTIVRGVRDLCAQAHLPVPHLITESGRAMTAHHAVLITQVTDFERPSYTQAALAMPVAEAPAILRELWQNYHELSARTALEAYHDAGYLLAEAYSLYNHGLLNLQQRAQAEQIHTALCLNLRQYLVADNRAHREVLDQLDEKLAAKYFCNLSIFQSMPDVWALEQIFPVVPLHRLDEAPTLRGVLEDLTCDSDGRIDHYVDAHGISSSLPLHEPRPGEPYLLGFFMLGAYQEILGDMHNLFGDTDAVNVQLEADGSYTLLEPEHGDSTAQLLAYVHYEPQRLLRSYRDKIEALQLPAEQAQAYLVELQAGLEGYTYFKT
jgi:arginine decarboxylase